MKDHLNWKLMLMRDVVNGLAIALTAWLLPGMDVVVPKLLNFLLLGAVFGLLNAFRFFIAAALLISFFAIRDPRIVGDLEPLGNPLYVAILWHQHQPKYLKNLETGEYMEPWVRLHAIKDYYDMVAILDGYPDIHFTVNLTPVLLRQLADVIDQVADALGEDGVREQAPAGRARVVLDAHVLCELHLRLA